MDLKFTSCGSYMMPLESPCVKICELDQHQVCLGCQRTQDEIAQWTTMTREQQLEVIQRLKEL